MALTGLTEPYEWMHGYNTIPLMVADTGATQELGYQYLVNVYTDDIYSAPSSTGVAIGSEIYHQIDFGTPHNLKLGDTLHEILSYDLKIYTVLSLPSSTSIVIDEIYSGSKSFTLYNLVVPYKILPDPNGYGKVDLGNSLKNYVTENFEDSNDIYSGVDTHDKFYVRAGYETLQNEIEFKDTYFVSGQVGLIIDTQDASKIQVGDTIRVNPEPIALTYNNSFSYDISVIDPTLTGNYVAYILDDAIAIDLFGDATNKYNINVEGQVTYTDWNGQTVIFGAYSSTIILTLKKTSVTAGTYTGEGGVLYCNPVPEYKTTATVKSVDQVGAVFPDYVVWTTIAWTKSTPVLTGKITLPVSNRIINFIDGLDYDLNVYNAYVTNHDWNLTAMNDYLIRDTTLSGGPSTILSRTERNRIEQSTKSWLLFHNLTTGIADGVKYQFYDSTGSLLADVYLENASGNEDDFYAPVGIDQLINATNKTDTTPLSSVVDDVDYYTVRALKDYGVTFSGIGETITFELNDDCSRYDLLHLIWKDAKGSWLSYPFKYIHTDSTEVSRSEFYQQPYNWDSNDFNYKGNKSYFTRGRDKKILNSGWVTEYENELIRDLLLSAHTYLQDKDGNIFGCQIITNNLAFGSNQKDDLFQYTLEIKLSNDEIRL